MDDINLGSYPRPRLCPCIVSHDQLWTALVAVSSLWSYSGHFSQAFATSRPTPRPRPPTPPPRPRPPTHPPPTPLAKLSQNWCAPSKKRSEMA